MPGRKTKTKSPKRTTKKTTVRSPKRTTTKSPKRTAKGTTVRSPKRTTKKTTVRSPKRTTTKSPKRTTKKTTVRSPKRTTKRTKRGLPTGYENESMKDLNDMAIMSDDTRREGQLQKVNQEVRDRLEKLANKKNTANLKLLIPAIRDREFQKADRLFESLLKQTDDDSTKKEIEGYRKIVKALSKKEYLYR